MKFIAKTFYALFITALVGVAGLFLATMLPTAWAGGLEVKIVKSGSMEPAIPTGSIVFVRPAAEYRVGDIVTFGADTRSEIPTTHRIIEVQNNEGRVAFLTQGDANEDPDPRAIAMSEVIGKVWLHVPYAGYVLDFARQPLGFTLMIGIPAGLIIVDEVLRIIMEVSKMRRRTRDEEEVAVAFREEAPPAPAPKLKPTIRHFDIPPPQNYEAR